MGGGGLGNVLHGGGNSGVPGKRWAGGEDSRKGIRDLGEEEKRNCFPSERTGRWTSYKSAICGVRKKRHGKRKKEAFISWGQ